MLHIVAVAPRCWEASSTNSYLASSGAGSIGATDGSDRDHSIKGSGRGTGELQVGILVLSAIGVPIPISEIAGVLSGTLGRSEV